jgi:hypothetical protein
VPLRRRAPAATSLASTSPRRHDAGIHVAAPLVHIARRHAAPHHWRAALHNSNNRHYVKLCIERYQWLSRKQREKADRGVSKHKM